jgi:hypothetical protein
MLVVDRLAQEPALEAQRVERVQIVAHDPRFGKVRDGRDHIADDNRRLLSRFDHDHLMVGCVASRTPYAHARHDGGVLVDQLKNAGLRQRREILGQVACPVPLIRRSRVLPFAATDDVLRPGKARVQLPVPVAGGETAGVVEVQVRRQDDIDRLRRDARLRQTVIEVSDSLQPEDLRLLSSRLVSYTRVDQHRPRSPHEQRAHREPDAVALVGGRPRLPQDLRHDTEHRAAIEMEEAVTERDQLEIAEPYPSRALARGSDGLHRNRGLRGHALPRPRVRASRGGRREPPPGPRTAMYESGVAMSLLSWIRASSAAGDRSIHRCISPRRSDLAPRPAAPARRGVTPASGTISSTQ